MMTLVSGLYTGKRPTHACMMWGGYQGSAPYEDAAIYLVNLRNPNKDVYKRQSMCGTLTGILAGYITNCYIWIAINSLKSVNSYDILFLLESVLTQK